MTDRLEQKTIRKLTSVGSVLKNPFKNLEDILTHLGELKEDSLSKREGVYAKEHEISTIGEEARRALITVVEKSGFPSEGLNKVFHELGEMFKVCSVCGEGTMEDEMLSGICYDCYRKGEVIHAQNRRIGELEKQVRNMKSKLSTPPPRDYMSDIIDEILTTIRQDIEHNFKSMKHEASSTQNVTPPPPPPPPAALGNVKNYQLDGLDIDFSKMTFEELKQYTPDFLSELPLSLRNQYNTRQKELKLIKKMTPNQRKSYFRKKKKEQEQAALLDDLKNSLKNLSVSDNALFLKMKQQAEKSVLTGQGTLGNFGQKIIFINCHKCNTTNRIIESKKAMCEKCHAPLRV